MKTIKFAVAALATLIAGTQAWAQSNAIPGTGGAAQVNDVSSVAISGTGGITVVPRIGPDAVPANNVPIDNSPAGLAYVPGSENFLGTEISPTDGIPSPGQTTVGPTSIAFFTITKNSALTAGASDAFVGYGTVTNTPTPYWTYPTITTALTPGSFSGLTYAAANFSLGSGTTSTSFYTIHHLSGTDYFSTIVYTSEVVVDLKPMSGPGAAVATGFFSLTYGTSVPGTAGNNMWYLRTAGSGDHFLANGVAGAVSAPLNDTLFGYTAPALASGCYDVTDLSAANTAGSFGGTAAALSGYTAFTFVPAVPTTGLYTGNVFYYLRQDATTGFTVLGKLDATAGLRTLSDIANLGAVYTSLVFSPDSTGITTGGGAVWGNNQLYVTGPTPKTAQVISFAAIADQTLTTPASSFNVSPTTTSSLPLTLTVAPSSTGTAAITGPVAGVWTITPTGPGIITLKASQAGQAVLPLFTANSMQQSFHALGVPIINSAVTGAATVGSPFSFAVTALGSPTSFAATSGLPADGLTLSTTTGIISGTPVAQGVFPISLVATNGTGSSVATTLTITVGPTTLGSAPAIVNTPLTVAANLGVPFNFTIIATGSPASYTASALPAGLVFNSLTGVISGTPTTVGVTAVQLSARGGNGTGFATLTITVAGPGVAPIITNNPLTAAGTVGTPFGYTIAASGLPLTYTASPLPAGLTIVASTGFITGIPLTAGTSVVTLGATNASGTGNATLTITVALATVAPIITGPATAPGTAGAPFVTYQIVATGLPTSYTATGLPAGLTLNPLTGAINGTPTVTGTFVVTISATNSAGTTTSTLTIVIAAAAVAPIITSPATAVAMAGTPFVTYLIGATGLPTSYSATGLPPGLTLNPLTGAINGTPTGAGTYVVTITATNTTGTSTASLTITVSAALFSRIVNFSARAQAGSGSQVLTLGFVVSGANKALLVRGDGPALIPFGVSNVLPDPVLTVFSGNTVVATDTGWSTGGNASALVVTAAQVGAFPLAAGSADSALIAVLSSGAYEAQIVGASGDTGTALAEVYDADSNLSARLVNASARMQINLAGGNLNPLIIGFVISGNTPKTVLIRGIGPGLSAFGVTGVLANPQITLFSGSSQLATNANWTSGGNAAQLSATFAQVGAFPLSSGNLDSAMTATLQPGTYTVQIIGVGNTGGVALLEIYDVQ